ncbi:hypothetical protein C5S35_02820, partial [Candidatus Methanophagaceae archaeon]
RQNEKLLLNTAKALSFFEERKAIMAVLRMIDDERLVEPVLEEMRKMIRMILDNKSHLELSNIIELFIDKGIVETEECVEEQA